MSASVDFRVTPKIPAVLKNRKQSRSPPPPLLD